MQVFTAASHQDVLALVTQIAILLLTARTLGELAQRLGQPSVIGELLAGIILGPSCLGKLFPVLYGITIPEQGVQGYLIEVISLLGAMFLLLITGLETDLNLIRRHARTAIGVSAGGVIVPFVSGFLLGQYLPNSLLPFEGNRLIFSLFVATALSISAIPVIAKVLLDMKLMRRDIGQIIIAAGMTDDTIGWILLSFVTGLAHGKAVTFATITWDVAIMALFLAFSFTIGRWVIKRSLDFVQDQCVSQHKLLTLVIVFMFTWGSLTKLIHLEPVLGAFIIGILFGQMPRLPTVVHTRLQAITIGIFAPIFFAVAGLKVNILTLLNPEFIKITLLVILIAILGKVIGAYLGARIVSRTNHWTALSYGIGLNARGAMGTIVATIGLSLGILTQEMFSILVLMAMVTSFMTPALLRFSLKNVHPSEEEKKRLQQEELAKGSSLRRIHRVLVPLRYAQDKQKFPAIQLIKSKILQRISNRTKLSTTLLCIDQEKNKMRDIEFLNHIASFFPQQELVKKILTTPNVINGILDESNKFYDLLVLGASRQLTNENFIFSPLVDGLVSLSPCLTMIVHAKNIDPNWEPRRILVPTNGSFAAKRAAEFAFLLPISEEESVSVLHVLEREKNSWKFDLQGDLAKRQLKVAEKMVEELKELGEVGGVRTIAEVKIGTEPESTIIDVIKEKHIDMVILGTDVRPASDRLSLGPRVERILEKSPCPVIVLNSA